MMTKETAVPIIKAVNRRMRKLRALESPDYRDITTGWDYTTWRMVHPALSTLYQAACETYTGRSGRFVPTV